MSKALLFCCALLALAAPMAFAGLDLTAVACNTNTTPPPSTTFLFDCANPGVPQTVFACFQTRTNEDSVVALDSSLDLAVDNPGLPDWWHFEGGGCNASGWSADVVQSPSLCSGATNPWGTQPRITWAYGPLMRFGPNTGSFLVSQETSQQAPITLDAGTNYFAFNLNFFADNATQSGGACAGCGIGAVLVWTSALVLNIRAAAQPGAEENPVLIRGPGLVSDCLVWGSGGVPCGAVPTRNRTWGQLKSLYR